MRCLLLGFWVLLCSLPAVAAEMHALSMSGSPRYAEGFSHFAYVRPDAPKGGEVRLAALGTFDSFNPFIARGNSAEGLSLMFDTLTVQSLDEPFTEYGLLADRIDLAPDHSSVTFHLREEACFHDGSPVLAGDVAFSFQTLVALGSPLYAQYYAEVERVDVLNERAVRFVFKAGASRELPLILGQLAVFSQAFWRDRDFSEVSLEIPLGSGPYRIGKFKAGQQITYIRDPQYWGRDLPVNRGRHNFDTITYDYYRDLSVTLEAFKAGEYDFRQEFNSKQWATGYTGPAVRAGLIRTETIPHGLAQGMQGFVFNTRRPLFADVRVRKALNHAFDFEWSNTNLFYSQYVRSTSFFANSDMASEGPPSEAERELLSELPFPAEVATRPFVLPETDGTGNIRANLLAAQELLREAGWEVRDGKLTREGRPFVFEMLLVQPDFERVVLPFQRNLARLGITMRVRLVDASQYLARLREFDFDMIVGSFAQSLSPGNEQRSFWHSDAADMPGSRNYCGIREPGIDALVDLVIAAPDRETLLVRCKALDRALLWGWYVIPHWHVTSWRVAYWDKFGRPEVIPKYGLDFQAWWIDAQKAKDLSLRRKNMGAQ